VLVWLGVMLLAGNILALPLILLPRTVYQPFIRYCISAILRTFLWGSSVCGVMRLDLKALDQLNDQRGMVLIPNHPTMIDAFLVLSRVPRAICLMKASIGSNLFLGVGAYLAGYVSNRHADKMFRAAIDAVSEGNLLLVFPEGTRTTQQPVNPMQGAVALIAKKAEAPLQTILITTNSAYLSKGWKIWRAPETLPLIYRAVVGEKIMAEESLAASVERMQQYFETSLTLSIDPAITPEMLTDGTTSP
jgi:1-acyl-sn-glycerol-3-phosphate acyltransferase